MLLLLQKSLQNLLSDRMRPVVLFPSTSQAAITVPSFFPSAYSPSRYLKRRLFLRMRPVTHCTAGPMYSPDKLKAADWLGGPATRRRCARSRCATHSPLGTWVRLKVIGNWYSSLKDSTLSVKPRMGWIKFLMDLLPNQFRQFPINPNTTWESCHI